MAKSLTKLLDKYGLKEKIIVYVKDEGFNFNVMIGALKFVVNYKYFGLKKNFQGICFRHMFSKARQYGIAKEKVYRNLKYVSIKSTQTNLQKYIIWPKKSRKGK